MTGRQRRGLRRPAGIAGWILLCGLVAMAARGDGGPLRREAARWNRRDVQLQPPVSVRLFPGQAVTLSAAMEQPSSDSTKWIALLVREGDVAPRTLAMASNPGGGGADPLSVSFVVPTGRTLQVFASYRAREGHAVLCREAYRIAPLEDVRELRGMDAAVRDSLLAFFSGCIHRINETDADGLVRLFHPEVMPWLSGADSHADILRRAFGAKTHPIPACRSVAYRSVPAEDGSGLRLEEVSSWPVRPEVNVMIEYPVSPGSNEVLTVHAARLDGEWRLVLPVQDGDCSRREAVDQ